MKKGFFFDNGQILIINEDIFTAKKIAPESIDLVVTPPDSLGILGERFGTVCDSTSGTYRCAQQKLVEKNEWV